jgi:hypothetical protein
LLIYRTKALIQRTWPELMGAPVSFVKVTNSHIIGPITGND